MRGGEIREGGEKKEEERAEGRICDDQRRASGIRSDMMDEMMIYDGDADDADGEDDEG